VVPSASGAVKISPFGFSGRGRPVTSGPGKCISVLVR
jgi:hypothetical protein